jgi:DNA-binding MarR family transcriptional regulator
MGSPRGTSPAQEAGEVADRLHSAAIHLLRRVRARDAELGLSGPRLSALSVLVFGGAQSLGELAAAEQVRSPTMTRLVDGLEREGLVTREPNPDDARSVLVRATPTGRLVLSRGRAARVEELTARLATLDAPDLGVLREASALIERIVRDTAEGA